MILRMAVLLLLLVHNDDSTAAAGGVAELCYSNRKITSSSMYYYNLHANIFLGAETSVRDLACCCLLGAIAPYRRKQETLALSRRAPSCTKNSVSTSEASCGEPSMSAVAESPGSRCRQQQQQHQDLHAALPPSEGNGFIARASAARKPHSQQQCRVDRPTGSAYDGCLLWEASKPVVKHAPNHCLSQSVARSQQHLPSPWCQRVLLSRLHEPSHVAVAAARRSFSLTPGDMTGNAFLVAATSIQASVPATSGVAFAMISHEHCRAAYIQAACAAADAHAPTAGERENAGAAHGRGISVCNSRRSIAAAGQESKDSDGDVCSTRKTSATLRGAPQHRKTTQRYKTIGQRGCLAPSTRSAAVFSCAISVLLDPLKGFELHSSPVWVGRRPKVPQPFLSSIPPVAARARSHLPLGPPWFSSGGSPLSRSAWWGVLFDGAAAPYNNSSAPFSRRSCSFSNRNRSHYNCGSIAIAFLFLRERRFLVSCSRRGSSSFFPHRHSPSKTCSKHLFTWSNDGNENVATASKQSRECTRVAVKENPTNDGNSSIRKKNATILLSRNSSSTARDGGAWSEGTGASFDYICLTSPEAARIFSACWRSAGCPPIGTETLVCVGEGTRAASGKALEENLQLFMQEQQENKSPQQQQQPHEKKHRLLCQLTELSKLQQHQVAPPLKKQQRGRQGSKEEGEDAKREPKTHRLQDKPSSETPAETAAATVALLGPQVVSSLSTGAPSLSPNTRRDTNSDKSKCSSNISSNGSSSGTNSTTTNSTSCESTSDGNSVTPGVGTAAALNVSAPIPHPALFHGHFKAQRVRPSAAALNSGLELASSGRRSVAPAPEKAPITTTVDDEAYHYSASNTDAPIVSVAATDYVDAAAATADIAHGVDADGHSSTRGGSIHGVEGTCTTWCLETPSDARPPASKEIACVDCGWQPDQLAHFHQRDVFCSFRPSSSSGSVLAAELPPRPPLLQRLRAVLYHLFLNQQRSGQQHPQDFQERDHWQQQRQQRDDVRRFVKLSRRVTFREHARGPECPYTPEEAVECHVKLIYPTRAKEGRDDTEEVRLQPCCPCWLQTRVLWPASALARPTLQDTLEQRSLQHLPQYSFALGASGLLIKLRVKPVPYAECQHISKHVTASSVSAPTVASADLGLVQESTGKDEPGKTGGRGGLSLAVDSSSQSAALVAGHTDVTLLGLPLEKNTGRAPQHTVHDTQGIKTANRLFHVERYNTYTTTQVMLTDIERRAVLQCMQNFLRSSSAPSIKEEGNNRYGGPAKNSCARNTSERVGEHIYHAESYSAADKSGTHATLLRTHLNPFRSTDLTRTPSNVSGSGSATSKGNSRSTGATSSSSSGSGQNCFTYTQAPSNQSNTGVYRHKREIMEEACFSHRQTAELTQRKSKKPSEQGLVMVVLASPSAVWAWTANGLPVSAAECCAERQLPSYTAVHAGVRQERDIFLQRGRPSNMVQQRRALWEADSSGDFSTRRKSVTPESSQIDANCEYDEGSPEMCNREVSSSSSGNKKRTAQETSASSSWSNSQSRSNSRTNCAGGRTKLFDTYDHATARMPSFASDRDDSKSLVKEAHTTSVARGMKKLSGGEQEDAHVFFAEKRGGAEEFELLLRKCQQLFQEERKRRERDNQQRTSPQRLVGLCIGPTTGTAAEEAGFLETMTGEAGSVAAIADIVEGCALCTSWSFVDYANRARSGARGVQKTCTTSGEKKSTEESRTVDSMRCSGNNSKHHSTERSSKENDQAEAYYQFPTTPQQCNTVNAIVDEHSIELSNTHEGSNDGRVVEATREGGSNKRFGNETSNRRNLRDCTTVRGAREREDEENEGGLRGGRPPVLVILTRGKRASNDAVLQELQRRKQISIVKIATLEDLAQNKVDIRSHQHTGRLRTQHDQAHSQQQGHPVHNRNGCGVVPVHVLEVPLLQTQEGDGIFKQEQQRLIATLMELHHRHQEHQPTQPSPP